MQDSIIISTLIIVIAALTGLRQYFKYKEHRSMIERGLDPSLMETGKNTSRLFLYTGIFLLGIAIGIISGIILAGILDIPGETKECILISVIIFTGFSCFLCHYLFRNRHT